MKVIEPSVKRIYQKPGLEGLYEIIQIAAFVCYQTEKTKYKPKEFIEKVLLSKGHTRPLEFGTVFLKVPDTYNNILIIKKYRDNPYSRVISVDNDTNYYITTNFRVIMQGDFTSDKKAFENHYSLNWLNDLNSFWCEPTIYHETRPCFTMNMSRGCTDDFRTHITLSSICESTRWCLYSGDKFGKQLTFIKPYFLKEFDNKNNITPVDALKSKVLETLVYGSFIFIENAYNALMKLKDTQAQFGKRLLPLNIKAQLMLCGFNNSWDNFLWRRCDEHADPECVFIANQIKTLLNGK